MMDFFVRTFLSLALGGLIGLERERSGKTLVGVRTFASTSFFGFLTTMLKNEWMVAFGFAAVTVFAALLYHSKSGGHWGKGITTVLMVPFCFALGVMVGNGLYLEAGTAAIAITFLLVEKEQLHALVRTVSREEVIDILLFAVVTFIVFPLLPQTALSFNGLTFNLQYAWAIVVIVCAISFLTHLAIKYFRQKGAEYAALFGGVVSSIATLTLFTTKLKDTKTLVSVLAIASAGALVSDMILVAVIERGLLIKVLPPLGLILASFGATYFFLGKKLTETRIAPAKRPLSIRFIVEFAAILLVVSAVMNAAASNEAGLIGASFLGGTVSSTSAVASVAYLYLQGKAQAPAVALALTAAVLASLLAKSTLLALKHPKEKIVWAPFVMAVVAGTVGLWVSGWLQ